MSDHELPGDSSTWPTDPFRLLGMVPGASPRDLRKAYLKLIRAFKPEHHPEEFQKIRQAYESALELTSHFGTFIEDVTEANRLDPGIETPRTSEPLSKVENAPEPTIDPWELACRGETATAYQILTQRIDEQKPDDEEMYLQVYWLNTLVPGLDRSRQGIDWLISGLMECGANAGRLRELFRRELATDDDLCLSDWMLPFFRRKTAPALLLELAAARWKAARSNDRWSLILADVRSLRACLPDLDADTWARILLTASTNLAWADRPDSDQASAFCREVERLGHRQEDYGAELYQVEFIQVIKSGLDKIGRSAMMASLPGLFAMLSRSWDEPRHEFQTRLLAHVEEIAREPEMALQRIDQIHLWAPAVLGRLASLMGGLEPMDSRFHSSRDRVAIVPLIDRFLAEHRWNDYRTIRLPLLRFCLQEAISPGLVARTLADRPEFVMTGKSPLAHLIVEDWPLRHVYRATELSWEDPTTFPFSE